MVTDQALSSLLKSDARRIRIPSGLFDRIKANLQPAPDRLVTRFFTLLVSPAARREK